MPCIRTDIVDLNSSGCNDTHIWISWSESWTTPTGCYVKKVVLTGGYTCFMEVQQYLFKINSGIFRMRVDEVVIIMIIIILHFVLIINFIHNLLF